MSQPRDERANDVVERTQIDDASSSALRRTAVWVLAVQCLLALSWTLYVLYLPGLLAAAGIDKRWVAYVLIADQLIFALCDWMAGVYADRIALVWRRLGRIMTATTLVSSAALLAMPWIATAESAGLLLGTIFVWAACSSALRAPVFALLGRVRERHERGDRGGAQRRQAGMVSMALVGISLAGAIGPYLTLLLKGVDGRVPLALSALSLAMAGIWALRVERLLPRPMTDRGDPGNLARSRRRALSLAAIVFVAALGTQALVAILGLPLFQRFVGADAVVWIAWFWAGFGLGLMPGARVASGTQPFTSAAVALAAGTIAFVVARSSASIAILVGGMAIAGAAWGVFSTVVFTSAVSISKGYAALRGAGTASGMVFSALALATLSRLAFVAAGYGRTPVTTWLPIVAWLAAAVLLVVVARTLWRRTAIPASMSA